MRTAGHKRGVTIASYLLLCPAVYLWLILSNLQK